MIDAGIKELKDCLKFEEDYYRTVEAIYEAMSDQKQKDALEAYRELAIEYVVEKIK